MTVNHSAMIRVVVIGGGYASTLAAATGDMAGLLSLLAPDITWTAPGQGKISGTHRGPEEVYRFARTLAD